MGNMKKSKKLSNAGDEVKQYFDDEAKEEPFAKNKIINDDSEEEEEEEDDDDDDQEEEEESKNNETKSLSYSDNEDNIKDNNNEKIRNTNVSRKRKCEFSRLDDNISKKKEGLSLRWLPNGNKVSINIYVLLYSIQ